jgi:hypothetical protein
MLIDMVVVVAGGVKAASLRNLPQKRSRPRMTEIALAITAGAFNAFGIWQTAKHDDLPGTDVMIF